MISAHPDNLPRECPMSSGFTRSTSICKSLVALVVLAAALGGCASSKPAPGMSGLPDRVELNSVPYFAGKANHSGAMALAALLRQQGVEITPGLLDKPLHLPEQADQLQASTQRVAREYGMVVYPLDTDMRALLTQVAAGFPVLVRYTEGSAFWAEPRYAILVGYDRYKDRMLLRSANERRKVMSFSSFESNWRDAGGWAVLIQRPSQLPAEVDRQRWLKAADELARSGQESEAARAVKALH
jgi:hypothetical protein